MPHRPEERGRYGEPYTGTKAKAGHRQGGPEATSCRTPEGRAPTARWGLKGLRRTTGSSSKGAIPHDEPVGQRWGMVEPALWRRRRMGSPPSYHGVCGRHGGEETRVTQGDLVSSERQVWSTIV